MPDRPRLRCQTLEVEEGFLPAPATKLVITQHLRAVRDPPFWAWIIVGAFYDGDNNVLWSTEVFAGHLNIELESDDESTSTEESQAETEESDTESYIQSQPQRSNAAHNSFQYQHNLRQPSVAYSNPPPPPPFSWDPTRQGPVPGHWQAAFDPSIRRWVHTWQPLG
ncbi:Fc.00g027180.m01.CDS01 [Cosmosporella sp. VM-42]